MVKSLVYPLLESGTHKRSQPLVTPHHYLSERSSSETTESRPSPHFPDYVVVMSKLHIVFLSTVSYTFHCSLFCFVQTTSWSPTGGTNKVQIPAGSK